MKTSELTGAALDWCVLHSLDDERLKGADEHYDFDSWGNFSSDWAQGGPIIEREKINVWHVGQNNTFWVGSLDRVDPAPESYGPTPLIAAMRCFVAFKLGDEIDIPKELL